VVTPTLTVPVAENEVVNVNNLRAALSSTDLAKPLWDTEWGYSGGLGDPDLDSAFIVRHLLIQAGQGISRSFYYDWDSNDERALWSNTLTDCLTSGTANGSGYLCETGAAFQQVESWLAGATVPAPCTGPMPPATGVWTCSVMRPGGVQALAVWDTSQTCSGGNCTTSNYGYDPRYQQYFTRAFGSGSALGGGTVQIGAMPVLLSQ
jgi:hypothetical protein